jgi:hypothetical protein
VFLISKLDAHRLEVFARGLSVLLDHVTDRIGHRGGNRFHADGGGEACGGAHEQRGSSALVLHDCTAFPAGTLLKASIASAMVARSW